MLCRLFVAPRAPRLSPWLIPLALCWLLAGCDIPSVRDYQAAHSEAADTEQAEEETEEEPAVETAEESQPAAPADDPSGLFAKRVTGTKAPKLQVAAWATPPANAKGKFTLWNFWALDSEESKPAIEILNRWNVQFLDSLVVIGVSRDKVADLKGFADPPITYALGSDPLARTAKALKITAFPNAFLIDPRGLVRWQGSPFLLSDDQLASLIDRYKVETTAPAPKPLAKAKPAKNATAGKPGAPQLYMDRNGNKNLLGQPAPRFIISKWLTPQPELEGKMTLWVFWATWCPYCREAIPELNAMQEKYGDKLTIVGISDEAPAQVKRMKSPQLEFASAVDPQGRLHSQLKGNGVPSACLIDPQGVIRWHGHPGTLAQLDLQPTLDYYVRTTPAEAAAGGDEAAQGKE